MKIGIDCRDLLAGTQTGIGRFVSNFLRAVSLVENPPHLYLYGNQNTEFGNPVPWGKPLEMKFRRAPEAATWWWDRITLPAMVRRDKLDVFFSPFFKAPGIRTCPIATTIHDLLFLRMPPEISGKNSYYCQAFRSFAEEFSKRAAVILTVSEYSRNDIVQLLNVPEQKVYVVGNCVGPDFHPVNNPDELDLMRRQIGISGEYILYVGSHGSHKNLGGLLSVYHALEPELREKYRLVFAGRFDKGTAKLKQMINRLNLQNSVQLAGHIDDRLLPSLYSGASVFVTLSKWEGFGIPVLESMACGTPVLASNRTSIPEVAGGAAVLVDPEDNALCSRSLSQLLTDDGLRKKMSERGIDRAKVYSPDKFAKLALSAIIAALN